MFSEDFKKNDIRSVIASHRKMKRDINEIRKNAGNSDIRLFLDILKLNKDELLPFLALSEQITISRFGKNIFLYNPVYISDECINQCLYCSFGRRNRKIEILDEKNMINEFSFLADKGFQHVLIVSGQGNEEKNADLIISSKYRNFTTQRKIN